MLDPENFHRVQAVHWKKLPFWVFIPLALAFAGSIALIWYHPTASPTWAIWGNFLCQTASHFLTAFTWGPWKAKLSQDPAGGESPYLGEILRTHWIRTVLIIGYGAILLVWSIQVVR